MLNCLQAHSVQYSELKTFIPKYVIFCQAEPCERMQISHVRQLEERLHFDKSY